MPKIENSKTDEAVSDVDLHRDMFNVARKLKSYRSDFQTTLNGHGSFNCSKFHRLGVSNIPDTFDFVNNKHSSGKSSPESVSSEYNCKYSENVTELDARKLVLKISDLPVNKNNNVYRDMNDIRRFLIPLSVKVENVSPEGQTSIRSPTVKTLSENKILKVSCLQSISELEQVCGKRKIKFNKVPVQQSSRSRLKRLCTDAKVNNVSDESKPSEALTNSNESDSSDEDLAAYEVDMIVDDKIEDGEVYYCVKWVGYHSRSNTWEPMYHLVGCKELIEYYKALKNHNTKLTKTLLLHFIKDITTRKPVDLLCLTKLCAICSNQTEEYVVSLKLTVSQLKLKAKDVLEMSHAKINKLGLDLLKLMRFYEKRKFVLVKVQEWEQEINSTIDPVQYIKVENNADLDLPPFDFQFIPDYISTCADLYQDPVAFCKCTDCYANRNACCPHDSEGFFAYNRFKRLQLQSGYPIFECNKLCSCDKTCLNRVVQQGPKFKFSIFKTSNGCGWGLKTLDTIEKGEFVLEYLGEIITSEMAEVRGYIYDYIGRSYLFDLDYGTENCAYTVDARHVGSAAHFINHSCDPNLHVFAVWINNPDPNLPRLAFFARRKIKRFEELTFDYKMVNNREKRLKLEDQMTEELANPSSTSSAKKIACKCNSKNCRKYLF